MNISSIQRIAVLRSPAGLIDLKECMIQGNWTNFPHSLQELLKLSNGFITARGIHLYGTNDLVDRNATFEINEYCVGYLLIGDNSGGKGYLMCLTEEDHSIYSSDLGDLDVAGFKRESASLEEWLNQLN